MHSDISSALGIAELSLLKHVCRFCHPNGCHMQVERPYQSIGILHRSGGVEPLPITPQWNLIRNEFSLCYCVLYLGSAVVVDCESGKNQNHNNDNTSRRKFRNYPSANNFYVSFALQIGNN